jgi:hypothetical protein
VAASGAETCPPAVVSRRCGEGSLPAVGGRHHRGPPGVVDVWRPADADRRRCDRDRQRRCPRPGDTTSLSGAGAATHRPGTVPGDGPRRILSRCTLCRLRYRELLDAAHIVSYAEGGTHQVSNGLSFCKIHHAAYDSDIVGVRPDGVAEVRRDVLEETDGPMLRHGLRGVHGTRLLLPGAREKRPSVEGLERRWERFRGVG